ncbi:MAG: hypothetical protein ABW098_14200 [Candidatus Thiodiazotropha sp.]
MAKKGVLLVGMIVVFTGSMLTFNQSCTNSNQKLNKSNNIACKSNKDVVRILESINVILNDEKEPAYEKIIKYLVDMNRFRLVENRVVKGNWIQINKNVAIARTLHKNMFSEFDLYGEWYNDKSKTPKLNTVSQPYTNTYILIRGREVLDPTRLNLAGDCENIQLVIWLNKHIFNIDFSKGLLEITNRGS